MAGDVTPGDLTAALQRVADGQQDLGEVLVPRVYEVLRSIAAARMAQERPGHTLQATALVHEAYLRLLGNTHVAWTSWAHFYAAAAEAMRRILIDHARARKRAKRGGGRVPLPLNVADLASHNDREETLAVDEAIRRLEEQDARAAEIVRLRFYAGLRPTDS
jgi:RNA polymerase sigma factor (TIGR02999 family)